MIKEWAHETDSKNFEITLYGRIHLPSESDNTDIRGCIELLEYIFNVFSSEENVKVTPKIDILHKEGKISKTVNYSELELCLGTFLREMFGSLTLPKVCYYKIWDCEESNEDGYSKSIVFCVSGNSLQLIRDFIYLKISQEYRVDLYSNTGKCLMEILEIIDEILGITK